MLGYQIADSMDRDDLFAELLAEEMHIGEISITEDLKSMRLIIYPDSDGYYFKLNYNDFMSMAAHAARRIWTMETNKTEIEIDQDDDEEPYSNMTPSIIRPWKKETIRYALSRNKDDCIELYSDNVQWAEIVVAKNTDGMELVLYPNSEIFDFNFDYEEFMQVVTEAAQHLWKMRTGKELPKLDVAFR